MHALHQISKAALKALKLSLLTSWMRLTYMYLFLVDSPGPFLFILGLVYVVVIEKGPGYLIYPWFLNVISGLSKGIVHRLVMMLPSNHRPTDGIICGIVV